jgi:hypothetical protein
LYETASATASENKPEYFLTLLLRDDKANAVIIEEHIGKIKIIAHHEEHFPVSIEDASQDELMEILDQTISAAEDKLPANISISKTVFGVKESWVQEKRIKKEYLMKLKPVCEGLDLSPIGFLVTSEAISHLLQEEEGAPLSAVLVEVGKNALTLSLFRGGRLIETLHADIDGPIPEKVDDTLKRFNVEVLPSRIIIFDGDREEILSQKFISHQWSKSLPFLHMPQVAILPKGFDARAIVFGAATQMGFAVTSQIFSKDSHDVRILKKEETARHHKEETEEDFGFTSDATESEHVQEDLTEEQLTGDEEEKKSYDHPPEDLSGATLENFGFVNDEDVADNEEKTEHPDTDRHHEGPKIQRPTSHLSKPTHAIRDFYS